MFCFSGSKILTVFNWVINQLLVVVTARKSHVSCSQEGVLRYWVIAWAVWNGVMFQKNSQPFQIIILFIRSISEPVLQTDAGTKGSATWLSSGSWTCQHLSCELLWLSRCLLLACSKWEVMQPVGILQLRLLLCSKGRLTSSAQQPGHLT